LLLIFIESLADFGNPLTLGGRFNVLSVQAYLMITGTDDLAGGSALALALLIPSVAIYFVQNHLLERRSFVTITGKPSRPAGPVLGPSGKAAVGGFSLLVAAMIALFYGLLIFGSFVKLWGADSTGTLENYAKAFRFSGKDILDSLILATVSAPLSAVISV